MDISPITTVGSSFTCLSLIGTGCYAGASYPSIYSPASGQTSTYDLYLWSYIDGVGGGQNLQQNTAYTFSAYTVNGYGQGTRVSAPSIKVGWKGTPKMPTGLYANYVTPTSFVLNWTAPSDIGQGRSNGYTLVASPNTYQVQIRIPVESLRVVISFLFVQTVIIILLLPT